MNKIKNFNIYKIPVGWKEWIFLKITLDDGTFGFADCTDSNGSVQGTISTLKMFCNQIIGMNPMYTEMIKHKLFRGSRQSSGGVVAKALSGVLNCLIEIKSKILNLPVYMIFGGPVRDSIEIYWSHCFSTRIRYKDSKYKKIENLDDLKSYCKNINESGFKTIKTNIIVQEKNKLEIISQGFKYETGNANLSLSDEKLNSFFHIFNLIQKELNEDISIIIDLNMHLNKSTLKEVFNFFSKNKIKWLEIDSDNYESLKSLKPEFIPIASCEKKTSLLEFLPYITSNSIDICVVDVRWVGFEEALRIAHFCELFNINIAIHNSGSFLSTSMAGHLSMCTTNILNIEYDHDDSSEREKIFNSKPNIINGELKVPRQAGWGVDINQEYISKYEEK